jgi:hypothetical protein
VVFFHNLSDNVMTHTQSTDRVPTDRLLTPHVHHNRSEPAAVIDGDAPASWFNDLDDTTVFFERSVGRFRVELEAHTARDLDLSWLVTDAVRTEDDLRILSSCRYTQADVKEHGADAVTEWINSDRMHMADIIRAYVGMQSTPRVFMARAVVRLRRNNMILGRSSFLGQCIYDSWADFTGHADGRTPWDGYAEDLIREAIGDARHELEDLRSVVCAVPDGARESA